jgi:leader peptidase (prepilin peptidase)/N-methyltransferase
MIRTLGTIFAGLLGLAFGSFLNVCLSRWPEGESVVRPRSHCRQCGRTLTWWENLPLVSWLALGGRCRSCKCWIGWHYPFIEAVVGALWAIAFFHATAQFDPLASNALIAIFFAETALEWLFLWLLVALAALDAKHLWLPDWLTLPGAALGLLVAAARPWAQFLAEATTSQPQSSGWVEAKFVLWMAGLYRLAAIFMAAGLILVIRWLYQWVRKQEGLGLGDAKLMALLAAWLGLRGTLVAFVLAVTLGLIAALFLLIQPKAADPEAAWSQKRLPLGTFLCIGGMISALWGTPILEAYLRWAMGGSF